MDFNQKDTTVYRFKLIQEMLSCTSSETFPTISNFFYPSRFSFAPPLDNLKFNGYTQLVVSWLAGCRFAIKK
jgi:hypothetical protein